MSRNWFIGIDYEGREGHEPYYKAVEVSPPEGEKLRFETGDITADYQAAKQYIRDQGAPWFLESSSITDFLFDVPGWRETWDGDIVPDPKETRFWCPFKGDLVDPEDLTYRSKHDINPEEWIKL